MAPDQVDAHQRVHGVVAQQLGGGLVGFQHEALAVQQQWQRHMVEECAVADFRRTLRVAGQVLGRDVAHHAPVADETAAGVVPWLAADQDLPLGALRTLPAQGQVAHRALCGHVLAQQGAALRVGQQLRRRPGRLAQQRGQGPEPALPVTPADLGVGAAGVGFPVGRCGNAEQRAKALLAGRGCVQVLLQQAGHAPADQRTEDERGAQQHRAGAQRRCTQRGPHHAPAFGQGQAHHHRQRQPQAGVAQARRAHHVGDAHRHRKKRHTGCQHAPAGQCAHQPHQPEAGEQHRAHQAPGGGRRRLRRDARQHGQAAIAQHHQGAHQRRLWPTQQRRGHRAQQADERHGDEKRAQHPVLQGGLQIGGQGLVVGGHGRWVDRVISVAASAGWWCRPCGRWHSGMPRGAPVDAVAETSAGAGG